MLFDTHCHVHDDKFLGEREQILLRAREAGVAGFICIGCDIPTTLGAQSLANANKDVFFSSGIHPHEASTGTPETLAQIAELARDPRCVAIGECGLDYHYDHSPRDVQQHVFDQQIALSKLLNKTLVIHLRDAWDDCIAALKSHTPMTNPVIIHCFTGNCENAKQMLELGCYLSMSGIITFAKPGALPDVVKMMPLNRLLIETDSPYLAPLPHRGKRNEPAFLPVIAQRIADILEMPLEQLARTTWENTQRAFPLLTHAV